MAKIAALFPQCVTERIGKDGTAELAIDFDKLRDELSKDLLDGAEERYQFTWPDKRVASRLANEATDKTLRPDLDASEDFWNTKNLYIEGDNLDVLKVLRENYLGAIKMIYIDPPYNTGNDFVYNDDFAQTREDFEATSGAFDEEGNQLIDPMQRNTESNGRFHTDWLNMIYPRLKVARDLLSDDGAIFLSIDNNEVENLRKLMDEVFGEPNCVGVIANTNNPKGRSDDKYVATAHEYILCYAKDINSLSWFGFEPGLEITKRYNKVDESGRCFRDIDLRKTGENDLREDRPNLFYYFIYNQSTGEFYPSREKIITDDCVVISPIREDGKEGNWRWGIDSAQKQISDLYPKFMPTRKIWGVMQKDYLDDRDFVKPTSSWSFKDVNSERGTEEFISLGFDKRVFPKPKPVGTICRLLKLATAHISSSDTILDFFSGSATTAHAVMKLNAEDGGKRKFIMVQLPEVTDEQSVARKAGYETICQIGEERIRRAGKKIKEELYAKADLINSRALAKGAIGDECDKPVSLWHDLYDDDAKNEIIVEGNKIKEQADKLDFGFRVLKLDSSNMEDVFYTPEDFDAKDIFTSVDNVKPDRTPLDLLFQVMPELNIELSAKIEEKEVNGKKVFFVDDNYLIATFDTEVNESTVTEIAKMKPQYFVMRDASAANDNVLDNFEQIFRHYSPDTIRKIL